VIALPRPQGSGQHTDAERGTGPINDGGQVRKLRILCLHGYQGTGDILRRQMSPLLSELPPAYEFVYVDSPSLTENDFGWWHLNFRGWRRTTAWASRYLAEHGPFDGVFGFSQGAALTSLLVGLRAGDGQPGDQRPFSFEFAMMAGGFKCDSPDFTGLYAARDNYRLPSLHIMGQSDVIVPAADSRVLAAQFDSPVVLTHPGGHVVASTPPVRQAVTRFLAKMAERRE
jgi:pimeloyl-ACP methyl ester carboxylesterase